MRLELNMVLQAMEVQEAQAIPQDQTQQRSLHQLATAAEMH